MINNINTLSHKKSCKNEDYVAHLLQQIFKLKQITDSDHIQLLQSEILHELKLLSFKDRKIIYLLCLDNEIIINNLDHHEIEYLISYLNGFQNIHFLTTDNITISVYDFIKQFKYSLVNNQELNNNISGENFQNCLQALGNSTDQNNNLNLFLEIFETYYEYAFKKFTYYEKISTFCQHHFQSYYHDIHTFITTRYNGFEKEEEKIIIPDYSENITKLQHNLILTEQMIDQLNQYLISLNIPNLKKINLDYNKETYQEQINKLKLECKYYDSKLDIAIILNKFHLGLLGCKSINPLLDEILIEYFLKLDNIDEAKKIISLFGKLVLEKENLILNSVNQDIKTQVINFIENIKIIDIIDNHFSNIIRSRILILEYFNIENSKLGYDIKRLNLNYKSSRDNLITFLKYQVKLCKEHKNTDSIQELLYYFNIKIEYYNSLIIFLLELKDKISNIPYIIGIFDINFFDELIAKNTYIKVSIEEIKEILSKLDLQYKTGEPEHHNN